MTTLVPPDAAAAGGVTAPPSSTVKHGRGRWASLRLPPPRPAQVSRPLQPMTNGRIVAAAALISLCALSLWCVVYVVFISDVQHSRDQHQLYSTFRQELALATAPIGGMIATGTPVAVLTVPNAGLHGEVVVEGTTSDALRSGTGHVRTSPLPGQPGVSVLYGRALSFGAPFGRIGDLRAGARITATTDQGTFHYLVTGVRHAGDTWTLPASGAGALTLVTSDGGWTPQRLVYVDASLQGKPQPDPGGRPTALAPQEKPMAGQHDGLTLVKVVLWLQLLVVLSCALAWLGTRWSRWQVWLVAAPCLLAVLWGASSAAVVVLPNLL